MKQTTGPGSPREISEICQFVTEAWAGALFDLAQGNDQIAKTAQGAAAILPKIPGPVFAAALMARVRTML